MLTETAWLTLLFISTITCMVTDQGQRHCHLNCWSTKYKSHLFGLISECIYRQRLRLIIEENSTLFLTVEPRKSIYSTNLDAQQHSCSYIYNQLLVSSLVFMAFLHIDV